MRIGIALFLFASSIASVAYADAITMPPSCPTGSTDAFCHGPATCRPRTCTTQSQCSAGEVCAPTALCTDTHQCFGLAMSTTVTNVLGACDASGGCAMGTCSTMSVCVAGSAIDGGGIANDGGVAPMHSTYCGCRAGTRGGGALAIGAVGLVLAMAARRRR